MSTQPLAAPGLAETSQVLIKLGEMGAQLAVINEKLGQLPDHENRIRALERFKWTIGGLALAGGVVSGAIGYWIGHIIH